MLAWIIGRVQNKASGVDTAVGVMPTYKDINWTGLEGMTETKFSELTSLDSDKWQKEVKSSAEFFAKFEGPLPAGFEKIQNQIATGFVGKSETKSKDRFGEVVF